MTVRIDRAQELILGHGVDALIVSPGPDFRYLTGYNALPLERLTALIIPAEANPVMLVPELEVPAALAAGVTSDIMAWPETANPFDLVAEVLGDAETVAVNDHMWAARLFAIQEALPEAHLTIGGALLSHLRIRKDSSERAALRDAGAAIDRVHNRMGEWLRAGRTEREVGADIARAILDEGHEQVDFVIVASGPNGASPHHETSNRVIEAGDPVVVDIGGTNAAGYCSDSTRNYVVGDHVDPEYREMYAVLLEAQTAQRAAAAPSVTAHDLDAIGRDIIEAAGFGAQFVHRTGHGIGVETHEEPYIVAGNDLLLEAGMAFSIEPGIYRQGFFGARIEDILICTENGAESVNNTERNIRFL